MDVSLTYGRKKGFPVGIQKNLKGRSLAVSSTYSKKMSSINEALRYVEEQHGKHPLTDAVDGNPRPVKHSKVGVDALLTRMEKAARAVLDETKLSRETIGLQKEYNKAAMRAWKAEKDLAALQDELRTTKAGYERERVGLQTELRKSSDRIAALQTELQATKDGFDTQLNAIKTDLDKVRTERSALQAELKIATERPRPTKGPVSVEYPRRLARVGDYLLLQGGDSVYLGRCVKIWRADRELEIRAYNTYDGVGFLPSWWCADTDTEWLSMEAPNDDYEPYLSCVGVKDVLAVIGPDLDEGYKLPPVILDLIQQRQWIIPSVQRK